jgi:hypothetical protein
MVDYLLEVVFQHPDENGKMTDGFPEKQSKGLDPKSDLYQLCEQVREKIKARFPEYLTFPSRPLHVELIHDREMKKEVGDEIKWSKQDQGKELLVRAKRLSKKINVHDVNNWQELKRAFVLRLPSLKEYPDPHITIVCFKGEKPPLEGLRKCVSDCFTTG